MFQIECMRCKYCIYLEEMKCFMLEYSCGIPLLEEKHGKKEI